MPLEAADRHTMQCMEIWGGSDAVETSLRTPGLDTWVYSRPFEGADAGGDVYYVSLCGGGVITRLIVADVSGHGAAVAEIARALRSLMRQNINRKSQARLVGALNRQFLKLAEMRRFATAVVATYLTTRDELSICNAGHPRPLWYRAAIGEWALLTHEVAGAAVGGSNLPLGLDDETPYDQFSVALGRGDVVLFYTDALIEANDPEGRMLGEDGLLNLARDLDATDPRALGPALLRSVEQHRGGRAADDDLTILALHHNAGPPPRLSIGQKLDVYAKVFGIKGV